MTQPSTPYKVIAQIVGAGYTVHLLKEIDRLNKAARCTICNSTNAAAYCDNCVEEV